MIKPDELELIRHVAASPAYTANVAEAFEMPPKRKLAILSKWERKSFWGSGVSTETGWATPEGIDAFMKVLDAATD